MSDRHGLLILIWRNDDRADISQDTPKMENF
jgi:hypothetical protein